MHVHLHIHLNNELLPSKSLSVNGTDVRLYFIGDSAYAIHTWLMKPFPHNAVLTPQQQTYNYRLCRVRMVVENANGRLKAWWRRHVKRNDMQVNNIPCVVAAACILHNMCEVHGETFHEVWLQDENHSSVFSQPPTSSCRDSTSQSATRVRNVLVHYITIN